MKIVLISTLYPPIVVGGAEKAAAMLAEALVRRGDEVAVISLHDGAEEIVEERNGVRVYRLPLDNIYWPFGSHARKSPTKRLMWHLRDLWNWRAARRVAALLDTEKPDVVHSHAIVGFSVAVWREAKRRGIRLVHTTHDYYLMCLRSDMFPGGKKCAGSCFQCTVGTAGKRFAAQSLDEVVTVSNFVLERHRARGYFEGVKASVGYNISPPVAHMTSREMPAADGELVFGYIGRVERQKGIHILLAATRLLKRDNWRLRIAGAGVASFVADLKKEYPDPRIVWLGFSNAPDFYASVDTVIVSSIWEDPLPYVSIESLEYGRSLLAARSGGIPEIAALGGVVETYSAENPAALAAAMDLALGDVTRWRSGGFADPEAYIRFSETVVVEEYRARYQGRT